MKKIFLSSIVFMLIGIGVLTSCKKDSETSASSSTQNYTNFKITSIKINAIPFLNSSNSSWDYSNGPDVYFNMENTSSVVLFNGRTSVHNDIAQASLPLNWNFISAYQITNIGVTQYITVYDYDTPDADDLIGYVTLRMDDHKSGYPTSITKVNGSISVTITGSWY